MRRISKTIGSLLLGGTFSLGLLVTGVQAQSGSLEPPGTAVDGSGDPVATTQTQPSWDQKLPASERFKLVLGGAAVLDKETGLVWERSPSQMTRSWVLAAHEGCTMREVGGRYGWQLPTIHQLYSLKDSTQLPRLPAGHLFLNIDSSLLTFWSSTELPDSSTTVYLVSFGFVNDVETGKGASLRSWCVRAS